MTLPAWVLAQVGSEPFTAAGQVGTLAVTVAGLVWVKAEVRQLRKDVRALREAWAAFTGKPLNDK